MEEKEKNPEGRPTDYKYEFAEQAFRLCLLGMNDKELSAYFGCCEKTLNNWKHEHVEFLQSVLNGREEADGKVAMAFYKRSIGYDYEETTYEKIHLNEPILTDAGLTDEAFKKKTVKKHLAADPGAAYNWLLNRQRGKWKNKTEIDHTSGGKPIPSVLNLSNGSQFSID